MTEIATLNRAQKKREADDLAAMLTFAPEYVQEAARRGGMARSLLENETAIFAAAYQRLKREAYRRARAGRGSPSLAEVAKKLREPLKKIAVFEKLSTKKGLKKVKLTPIEITDLEKGLELIREITKTAAARRKNLKTARNELEKKIETNTEFRRQIKDARAENARIAVQKRPKAAEVLGGQNGGTARAKKLSAKRKKEIGALGKKVQMENLAERQPKHRIKSDSGGQD